LSFPFRNGTAVQGVDKTYWLRWTDTSEDPQRGLIPCSDTRRSLTDAGDKSGAQFGVRRKEARVRSWVKKKHRLGRRGRKGEGERERQRQRERGLVLGFGNGAGGGAEAGRSRATVCVAGRKRSGAGGRGAHYARHVSSPALRLLRASGLATHRRGSIAPLCAFLHLLLLPSNQCLSGRMFVADSRFKFLVSVYAGR
jgi:hypothetical protein